MDRSLNLALIQYEIRSGWAENVARVESLLARASEMGADLAVLPEMFVQPYDMNLVPERAETIPGGRTCLELSRWAGSFGMALAGGSIAEKDENGRYFNTAMLWDQEGRLLARHRKVHLFDVDLPGGMSFRESAVFSPGREVTVADCLGLRLGLAVCYDVRFPELFRLMALAGAELAVLPGAFNHVSGPAHWEMLLRNRAVENTMYVAGVSGLSEPGAEYQAWGHSLLVDPFGEVLNNLGREQGVALGLVDPARLEDVRARLPVLRQRRSEVYRLLPAEKNPA
ncbi:MAG: carbon-nitrogen hydrolase family protein [Thermodesulfobacteriota bacterium]